MAQLNCITGSPAELRKPKIYLFCRPLLREYHVESLIQAISACRNCDIFWATEPIAAQERHALLADMQLFVLPVDFRLLAEPNEDIDRDIAFALDNHIPLLPVLMEPDIYSIYSLPHKFGTMTCLRYCKEPDSFLPFPDALRLAFVSLLPPETLLAEASGKLKSLPANSRKDLLRGIAAYFGINQEKNTTKGLTLLHKAAHAGNEEAATLLLRIYAYGLGTPANQQLALLFASRLVQNLEAQEAIRLPQQFPDYLLDISHLCNCVGRRDFTVRLTATLLDSLKLVLGKKHPLPRLYQDVLTTYCSRHRLDDEWMLQLCREQYLVARSQYGETHSETLARLRPVAYYSEKVGISQDALEHYKTIYTAYRQTLGEQAEETLSALCDVANQCKLMDKNQHAQELSATAYTLLLEVKGRHHPTTLHALEIQCDALLDLGKSRDHLRKLQQLYTCRRIALGKEHPLTLITGTKLALAFSSNNQKIRAVRHMTDVYKAYLHLYGSEYPLTQQTRNLLEFLKKTEEEDT